MAKPQKKGRDRPRTADEDTASRELGEVPVIRGNRWHLSLSATLAAASTLVGGVLGVVHYFEVQPLTQKAEDLRQTVTTLETERQSNKTLFDRLQQQYTELLRTTTRPILVYPADRASVIGASQTFVWDFKNHENVSGYVLEIKNLTDPSKPVTVSNVVRPETRRAFVAMTLAPSAEFLWRVRPGAVVGDRMVAQGEWSAPAAFRAYVSVESRVRSTGRLTVATTPTSYDSFVLSNGDGGYDGFEMELAQFVAAELSKIWNLPAQVTVETKEIPWNNLFTVMQNGEADVAIRSITRSVSRERQYPNLKFTVGYLRNHQILISLDPTKEFPRALSQSVVGAKQNSLNASAARYLASRYEFRVDDSYTAYGDLYQALRDGRVNFALVDSVLASPLLDQGQFFRLGGDLDVDLHHLYQRELGYDGEEYSILVHDSGPTDTLREAIDTILRSDAGIAALRSLKEKFKIPE